MERELQKMIEKRVFDQWGYRPDRGEAEEEYELMVKAIAEGIKAGYSIAFLEYPFPDNKKENLSAYTYEPKKGQKIDYLQAAKELLEIAAEKWSDSAREIAWVRKDLDRQQLEIIDMPQIPQFKGRDRGKKR